MKSLLFGNGVTIQFGGKEYLNEKIIKRAINNINIKNFPGEIYPREIKDWLLLLHSRIPAIVSGEYDDCAYTTGMKSSLIHFKERYADTTPKTKVHEIGFEDYFLVHFLVCFREKIVNPEKYHIKESLRCLFIDSIYNNGKIQNLYHQYPGKFVEFLKSFDNIYTTNYDWNVEKATGYSVQYLHGAFHHISEVYDPESFRNQLSDSPIKNTTLIKGFEHLYSNALTSYSGEDKKFALDMGISANIAIEKFVRGLKEKPELWDQVREWEKSDSQILKNMYEGIVLKTKQEDLRFKENKSLYNISELTGELSILGLSPFNDNHIFEAIMNNQQLNEIIYYYYDPHEANVVKSLLSSKNIKYVNSRELWASFS